MDCGVFSYHHHSPLFQHCQQWVWVLNGVGSFGWRLQVEVSEFTAPDFVHAGNCGCFSKRCASNKLPKKTRKPGLHLISKSLARAPIRV
jgi:hypothetical protein